MKLYDFELLESEAHRLSGTGATYGYPAISNAGCALELGLRNGVRDVAEISALLASLMTAISRALADVADDTNDIVAITHTPEKLPRSEYQPLVLAADDDPNVCQLLVELLKPFARVECFNSGYAVLEAARRQRVDLILLDYALPGLTGQEILAGLKASGEELAAPVIMLTARRDVSLVTQLVAAGVRDYVVKPFAPELLLERIKGILAKQKPVVLVADDDPLIREIFRNKLRQRGVDVFVATSGAQALDMARRLRPHAIILDRSMPRLDGLQVLASIRNNSALSSTPILILSARREEADVADGLAQGADDYICKPFLPDNVVERCLHLLRSNRQLAA